jgi:GNAT superfamily N-acetyltransferase
MAAPTLDVRPATIAEALASGIFDELDEDLKTRYPASWIPATDPQQYEGAGGCVVLASAGADVIGCGAFRLFDGETVELKRMFVRATHRGRGIARRIVEALEREARHRGYTAAVLETGTRQPEAIALYITCGYEPIERYGDYAQYARSVCFRKSLTRPT